MYSRVLANCDVARECGEIVGKRCGQTGQRVPGSRKQRQRRLIGRRSYTVCSPPSPACQTSSMLSSARRSLPQTLRSRAPVSRAQTAAISSISRSTGPLLQRTLRAAPAIPHRPAFTSVRAMSAESAVRPQPDKVLQDIADYVHNYKIDSPLAFETARLCLIDTIGCGLEALRFPACVNLLGPVVEGTVVPNGMFHLTCEKTRQ